VVRVAVVRRHDSIIRITLKKSRTNFN
jgi:hypothetical protein